MSDATLATNDQCNGARPLPFDRDTLGRFVREAWMRWAHMQPEPKPSWPVPYDNLNEADKEADRQIGEAVARWTLIGDAHRASAATDTSRDGDCGIVGVFTDRLGRIVETVSDFTSDCQGYGSVRDAQTRRAHHLLAIAVVRAYSSEMMHEAFEVGDCDRIVQRLVAMGAKVTFTPVGYEKDD